tara:strand:- start:344 stop:541 length:198 start_codon:yes stop_codon:yes gene_type:complete
MKILEEYTLSKNDWKQLIRAIQSIQEDNYSVTIWIDQIEISRWLHLTGKINAVKEIINERKKSII